MDIVGYVSLGVFGCILLTLGCTKCKKFCNEGNNLPKNTFFLVDEDIDRTSSIMTKLVGKSSGAFAKSVLFCSLIDKVPPNEVINIIIHTNGGDAIHCERMLRKLKSHPAGYIAYIKSPCYSAGSIIALGASEIVFDKSSNLGKIDIQTKDGQIMIYLNLDPMYISDRNIHLVEEARYHYNYELEILNLIFPLSDQSNIKDKVIQNMLLSLLPHHKTFNLQECIDMGLPVRPLKPEEQGFFDFNGTILDYTA
jgi:hypothetical protein